MTDPRGFQPIPTRPINDGVLHPGRIVRSPQTLVDGVFEGGGNLGTAYIGALMALEERGVWFKRVAGTSAGAITAALVAAGYTAEELNWLSAPPGTFPRPSRLPSGVDKPINFRAFLDFPGGPDNIKPATRRSTVLWKALRGEAIDTLRERLAQMRLPIPTRGSVVSTVLDLVRSFPGGAIVANAERFQQELGAALTFLPSSQPSLADFLPDTSQFRTTLADTIWTRFTQMSVSYRLGVNVLYENGLCEGEVFLQTMQRLLNGKLPQRTRGEVQFADLPIDLVVVAANTSTAQIEVYSRKTHPDLSVAEAVRRSMSIPLLFEPRLAEQASSAGPRVTHRIVDGGICSNYPYWLFSPTGRAYVDDNDDDQQRIKLGFLLDDERDVPSDWSVPRAKFHQRGRAVQPDSSAILAQMLGLELPDLKHSSLLILDAALRVQRIMDRKERLLHGVTAPAVMAGRTFHEVAIPLKGFHWLDFSINTVAHDYNSIVARGRRAAEDILAQIPLRVAVGG